MVDPGGDEGGGRRRRRVRRVVRRVVRVVRMSGSARLGQCGSEGRCMCGVGN